MKKNIAVLLILLSSALLSAAAVPSESYVYDSYGRVEKTPASFYAAEKFYPENGLKNKDLFILDGTLYSLLSDGTLITMDGSILHFTDADGFPWPFNEPSGLFITDEEVYITDIGEGEVYAFDRLTGRHLFTLGSPDSPSWDGSIPFVPSKVIVDSSKNVYVLVPDYYYGAVMYSKSHEFVGFFGANPTELSFSQTLDRNWKRLMNREQKDAMERFVPVAYSSFDIDEGDFVYTCSFNTTDKGLKIRKINPSGNGLWDGRNYSFGDTFPDGETDSALSSETRFKDLDVNDGFVYALDAGRGRVFVYDGYGRLLTAFAGLGNQKGLFVDPVAIEADEKGVYVLDASDSSITVFRPTGYALSLFDAEKLFQEGRYEEAEPFWQSVLDVGSDFEVAHLGLGRALAEKGEMKSALAELRLSGDREQYSEVYESIRLALMRKYLSLILFIVLLICVAIAVLRHRFGSRINLPSALKEHRTAFFHPVDTLWEMKRNERLGWLFPTVIVIILFLLNVISYFSTGFIFNENDPKAFNLSVSFMESAGLYILWCTVNYLVSAINDGKGSFKDIYSALSYALIPLIVGAFVNLLLSRILVLEEGSFMRYITVASRLWAFLLLMFITATIHEYDFAGTVKNLLLTLLGAVFVLFLLFLAVVLAENTVNLFSIAVNELRLRR